MSSSLDLRLSITPTEWSKPLAEVLDTASTVKLALDSLDINSPELLLALTELVLERHDKAE
jgi:hypothetical protein